MSDAWRALGGRRRTLARQVYGRDRSTPNYCCPKCNGPIDWVLEWPDPMSRSVGHQDELQDGGALTDLDNLWTEHLSCNASAGAARRWERSRSMSTNVIMIDPRTI
jgi:hypothetical protein